jgi:small subunit ribosomal protein S6
MAKAKATKAPKEIKQNSTYEAMFLVGPAAGADAENALKLARGIVERHQGEILVIKKWDERKLMYELKGQKRGTYILVYFTAPGASVSAIERDVNLSEEVLRVLVTKADHLNREEMEKVEPQPIQPREERSFDRAPWDQPSRPPRREERAPEGAGKE